MSTNIPKSSKSTNISVDILFIEGVPILHTVDKCTGWSETAVWRRRELSEQSGKFKKMQIYRHGVPKAIHCDREYNKGDFAKMRTEFNIKMNPVAVHDHEANGAIENANKTLRSYFRRLQAIDQKFPIADILA